MPEIKNIKYNSRAKTTTSLVKNAERVYDTSVTQFINATPIECNYYSYDNNMSTVGVGFKDDDGPMSGARKYNFIKDYVMYGFNAVKEMSKEEKEEIDISVEMAENQSLHLPNTIQPKEGDLITLHIENNSIFYIVVKAEPATFHNKSYWKIEWNKCEQLPYENYSHKDMERDGLIVNTYKFVPEHIGTDYSCFLKSDFYEKIVYLKEQREELNELYIDYFYDEHRNILIVEDEMSHTRREYITLLVDLQMEFKPLYVYNGEVNMVLHHETLIDKRTKMNWRKNPLRKFLKNKNTSILENGLSLRVWNYVTDPDVETYKLQSYLNDDRIYKIYDYGEDKKNKILNVPDEYYNLFTDWCNNTIKLDKLISEFKREKYDIDLSIEYLIYLPVLLYILDNFIAESILNEKIDRFY